MRRDAPRARAIGQFGDRVTHELFDRLEECALPVLGGEHVVGFRHRKKSDATHRLVVREVRLPEVALEHRVVCRAVEKEELVLPCNGDLERIDHGVVHLLVDSDRAPRFFGGFHRGGRRCRLFAFRCAQPGGELVAHRLGTAQCNALRRLHQQCVVALAAEQPFPRLDVSESFDIATQHSVRFLGTQSQHLGRVLFEVSLPRRARHRDRQIDEDLTVDAGDVLRRDESRARAAAEGREDETRDACLRCEELGRCDHVA